MGEKIDLGIVTAYGYAKSKGYEKTEDEFAEDLLKSAQYTENAKKSAETAEQAANTAATDTSTELRKELKDISEEASESAKYASDRKDEAKLWAVGDSGSGADEPSDTNSAYYWAQIALSASGGGIIPELVDELPVTNISTRTLYLVPSENPEEKNTRDEYLNKDGTVDGWELIGSTKIDLSDYYKKEQTDKLVEDIKKYCDDKVLESIEKGSESADAWVNYIVNDNLPDFIVSANANDTIYSMGDINAPRGGRRSNANPVIFANGTGGGTGSGINSGGYLIIGKTEEDVTLTDATNEHGESDARNMVTPKGNTIYYSVPMHSFAAADHFTLCTVDGISYTLRKECNVLTYPTRPTDQFLSIVDSILFDSTPKAGEGSMKIRNLSEDYANVYGAKNLIPYPYEYTTMTVNGITFVDNGDGSITVNGTATASFNYNLFGWQNIAGTFMQLLLGKKVIFSGTPDNVPLNKMRLYTEHFLDITKHERFAAEVPPGGEVEYAIPIDAPDFDFTIAIYEGAVISDVTLYPMLRLASIKDSTYVPYAKANHDLTRDIKELQGNLSEKVNYEHSGVVGAKNLCPEFKSDVKNGVTISVSSDGVVSVSGTATAETINEVDISSLPDGDYVLSGAPTGSSHNTFCFGIANADVNNWVTAGRSGEEAAFTISRSNPSLNWASCYIQFFAGYKADNLVFRPMIRLAYDTSQEYQPYAMTNRELTAAAKIPNAWISYITNGDLPDFIVSANINDTIYAVDNRGGKRANANPVIFANTVGGGIETGLWGGGYSIIGKTVQDVTLVDTTVHGDSAVYSKITPKGNRIYFSRQSGGFNFLDHATTCTVDGVSYTLRKPVNEIPEWAPVNEDRDYYAPTEQFLSIVDAILFDSAPVSGQGSVGINKINGATSIENGGTGANNAKEAMKNLGVGVFLGYSENFTMTPEEIDRSGIYKFPAHVNPDSVLAKAGFVDWVFILHMEYDGSGLFGIQLITDLSSTSKFGIRRRRNGIWNDVTFYQPKS